MDLQDYKPNSHAYKNQQKKAAEETERKKITKAVSGKVKVKKKSEISKFKDVFVSEDAGNVKTYIIFDVLIPAVKKAISDIVSNGVDMLLYGETRERRRSISSTVSYWSGVNGNRKDRRDDPRPRLGYSYDDIILETRGEAEEVLERMSELIDMYGVVSVADLYDLVGISGNYTDNKYGWTNIRNAEPIRVRDGYMLKLPKALPIN